MRAKISLKDLRRCRSFKSAGCGNFTLLPKIIKYLKGSLLIYDDPAARKMAETQSENKQDKVEIMYSSYIINKGVRDEIFK